MVLNGTIGARLHVAFPVLNRSSFGFWFSYFTVFSRIILAMFWFGIQVSHLLCHHIAQLVNRQVDSRITGHNAYIR
jgi:cytosine/uracil/thiamine/allantoin permease